MPNKVYHAPETAIKFSDTNGDLVLTLKNLAHTTGGRISARYDRGAGSQPALYKWRAVIQWEDNPAATDYAELIIATSDGTLADGTVGTADAALTAAQASNCDTLGIVRAEAATGSTNRISSGLVEIFDRYVSVGARNMSTTKNFKNSDDVSYIILTPVPPEIQ
jgi:hypothetical protein